jgi:predicted nucleic acid-binding protein
MLPSLPPGAPCFVDSNIFVYHFVELGEVSTACRAFLGQVQRLQVDASTAGACLADAIHRVMAIEAQERFHLGGGAVAWLQRHRDSVRELSGFLEAARPINGLRLRLLPTDARIIQDAAEISAQHGLLTNDAVIVALMRRHGLAHLVTNDDDFDRVPGLAVHKPR